MFFTRRQKPVEPTTVWAFWPYDTFPYFLSGKIIRHLPDGRVNVEGYSGMVFKPFYVAVGEHGEQLHNERVRLRYCYDQHMEAAQNAAGNLAFQRLSSLGMPESALMKLRRNGYQGDGYKPLFQALINREEQP